MHRLMLVLTVVIVPATGVAGAGPQLGQFQAGERFILDSDESHQGDLYFFGGQARVSGRQEGDFVAWAGKVRVDGEVTGDVIAAGGEVRIEGTVGDTVRAVGATVVVSATVDGDLVAFGGDVQITSDAHVTGNLIVCAGRARVDGTIDGSLLFKGGEIVLVGSVARGMDIEADTVRLGSAARVGGDITYESRKLMQLDDEAEVLGEILFNPVVEEEHDGTSWLGIFYRLWLMTGAMLTGLVAVALGRRTARPLVAQIDREALLGGLVGFGTSLIVPAAATMAIALILPAPLGVLALVIFLIVVYLAKLPVALWVGNRTLRLIGQSDPAPWMAMLLGLLVLYLLFWVPYLGKLVWLITVWLGLGTIMLAARAHLRGGAEVQAGRAAESPQPG